MAEQVRDTPTSAVGISVDPIGRLILKFLDKDGQRVTLDLTSEIERIADEKVKAHLHALHGHQI